MKTKLTVLAAIALIIGALIAMSIFNKSEVEDTRLADLNAEPFDTIRPDVQPVPNTFSIMSPEEKAAADEAARIAAEALIASSTASGTATSTEDEVFDDTEFVPTS